jgi:magnesium-transporting ATPase (P-type)
MWKRVFLALTDEVHRETNLKIKQASTQTAHLTTPGAVQALQGTLRSEHPNNSLYTYEGMLSIRPSPLSGFPSASGERQIPIGPDQVLLRGAQIRNTPWLYGVAIFTGHDTKLMRNATATPIKRTRVERQVNTHILFLFAVLLGLSLASSIGSLIRTVRIPSILGRMSEPISLAILLKSAVVSPSLRLGDKQRFVPVKIHHSKCSHKTTASQFVQGDI